MDGSMAPPGLPTPGVLTPDFVNGQLMMNTEGGRTRVGSADMATPKLVAAAAPAYMDLYTKLCAAQENWGSEDGGQRNCRTRRGHQLSAQVALAVPSPLCPPPGLPMCPYGVFKIHRGAQAGAERVISVGSVGHPTACMEACHVDDCMDPACPRCHICVAAGMPSPPMPTWSTTPNQYAAGLLPQYEVPACPSVGSLGHPHNCAKACKYHFKGQRCKDGQNCTRCHLCAWTRWSEKA